MARPAPFTTALCIIFLAGCSHKASNVALAPLAQEFLETSLSFSPTSATAQGMHTYKGRSLDSELDDLSADSITSQRDFYSSFNTRLKQIAPGSLAPEDRADYDIIQNQIALALLDIDMVRSWQRNPTGYVEIAGAALFNPYVLEYAPKPDRARHIIARLQKIPKLFDQGRRNLRSSPPVWVKVAREENEGNIALVEKTLREWIPGDQRAEYDRQSVSALAAMREFNRFLESELGQRRRGPQEPDWRLGQENYALKFKFALGTDLTPDQVLAAAEADLHTVRSRMSEIATKLGAPDISTALSRISEKRSTPATYFADAKADLEEARNFTQQKNLLTLPARSNLQVIETPAFMRGIYSVGGFNSAPALEPKLGAFYWITPIPSDWPAKRAESKLREYNFYKLKLLTIHEAMPGHYVQAEFANDVRPARRGALRAIFGNTPYVEGWAQYATQMLLDEGFLDHSPELRLTFLKEELRVLANAIIDIKLQTRRMTDQQAVDLMEKETFQEHEEAIGKLQRAQLSSAQLPSYLVGWRDWIRVRDQYRAAKGASFSLHDFNDAALKEGAVPLPVLFRLLTGSTLATGPAK